MKDSRRYEELAKHLDQGIVGSPRSPALLGLLEPGESGGGHGVERPAVPAPGGADDPLAQGGPASEHGALARAHIGRAPRCDHACQVGLERVAGARRGRQQAGTQEQALHSCHQGVS